MRFATPSRRRPTESIVPMINVVFLLLIFFMMTARIAPPRPFDLTPPQAESERALDRQRVLYLSKQGELAFGPLLGDAVWPALSAAGHGPLILRADLELPAPVLAKTLGRLAAVGITEVTLAVRSK